MSLTEQVYTQARLMAPELTEENQAMLEAVCASAVASLKGKLRESIGPEDCMTDFVTAAAMLSLAAMTELGTMTLPDRFTAGDLTMHGGGGETAAACLRYQAQMLMGPYIKGTFVFLGV